MHVFPILNTHFAAELFQGITLLKILVAVLVVVLLSFLAEHVSPRFAGILSGYPLGAAISLFFIGFEISPEFAGRSAVYTMVGLVATQTFAYCYYLASYLRNGQNKMANMGFAVLAGIAGYFAVASILQIWSPTLVFALVVPAVSILFFIALFRRVNNVKIQQRVGLSLKVLLLRSVVAAVFIVVITGTAKMVGPRWAGLFSAFPITLLPFVMIIHFTYDQEHVYAILKNVPKGIGSLVIYALSVCLMYPRYGIWIGTLISYLLATLYLIVIHLRIRLPRRPAHHRLH